MPVPDYQSLMLPFLEALADGQDHHLHEVRETVAPPFVERMAERIAGLFA